MAGHKKGFKKTFLWPTNDSFVALNQGDKQVLRKCRNAKKVDMVKIENHRTKKIDWGTICVVLKTMLSSYFCLMQVLKGTLSKIWGIKIKINSQTSIDTKFYAFYLEN